MRPCSAVVLLLLLAPAAPDRHYDYYKEDERLRRHDVEERQISNRRWTTSRNSPYQKIVSSYGHEMPEEGMDVVDQAKAKSIKRKPLRTSSATHDQITSETSAEAESEKVESENIASGKEQAHGGKKSGTPITRRRSSVVSDHLSSEVLLEISTTNNKKRRRITTTTTTTTLSPQTMSDTLYQYFRPLDKDVPQEVIIPFLDFGKKLSPIVPTPSGVNSIDSKTVVTKLRPAIQYQDKELHASDDELLQEDMDVTVVKKAIERNFVPRGKLRLREQGISDFYRKRVPVQVRTTENLISTSDSSTASSVQGPQQFGALKKLDAHKIHHSLPIKDIEQFDPVNYASAEISPSLKSIDFLPDKRRQYSRPIQRLASIKLENSHSPLTAESALVKTVIKELPKDEITTENEDLTKYPGITMRTSTESTQDELTTVPDNITPGKQQKVEANHNQNQKVLSTTVVTSVSIQEPVPNNSNTEQKIDSLISEQIISPLPLSALVPNNTNDSSTALVEAITQRNSIKSKTYNRILNSTKTITEVVTTTPKTDIPLRSRDIYKPKIISRGSSIPHLPRIIPISSAKVGSTVSPTTSLTEIIVNKTLASSTTLRTSTIKYPSTTIESSLKTETSIKPLETLPVSNTTSDPEISSTRDVNRSVLKSEKEFMVQDEIILPQPTTSTNYAGQSKLPSSSYTPSSPKTATVTYNVPVFIKPLKPEINNSSSEYHGDRNEYAAVYVDTESVPPPKHEESTEPVVVISPEDSSYNDKYPVYFTIPVTSTPPSMDEIKHDTEAMVVEQTNMTVSTTVTPGVDLVKLGAVEKEVEVVYPEPMGLAAYLLVGLGLVPVLLGVLVGARFIMTRNRKKVLDESEYSSEYNRSPLSVTSTPLPTKLPRLPTHLSWSETEKNPATAPPPGRWEVPREKLRLQTLLGQGNFGQVWKAEADDIAGHEGLTRLVAVKTVKECANAREREDLLRELGIMQELGAHPNVVTLLGCCTEKEPIYVVMEYVMYGKLLSFLRDYRTRAHYYNFSDGADALTSRDLTVFAYCVARGMDYLSNKSIIHRDIAARNVLVDHNKLCKIADFGMSRNVRDTGQIYEQRQSKGALPIRWMAPESLHFSLFTHKTDVWSFGILMWEIVTLGSTPYATMGAREVMRRVKSGYRLERPSHCRSELFRLIAQCWHSEPSKRPTFAELKAELGQLLNDAEHHGSFVDLDSYADQMRQDSLHRH